jgi:signal transduction histidine kinase
VTASVSALAKTLARIHTARGVTIDVRTTSGHAVGCQREDLDEMLGNLMDNACKWARTRVRVSSERAGADMAVVVQDDGPGLSEADRIRVLRRGVRLDEAVPGSGLGLAIASELAELYGGSLSLGLSADGGLAARLSLPAPRQAE